MSETSKRVWASVSVLEVGRTFDMGAGMKV
jgi:hypothetical protein